MIVLLMTLSACGGASEKIGEAITPSESELSEAKKQKEMDKTAEPLDKETEKMIDELTEIAAEKYSTTKEAYIAVLASEGKSPYDAFKLEADQMGITIKELHKYETSAMDDMTQEQKETMGAMATAAEEAGNTLESKVAIDAIEVVTSVHTNTSDQIRVVEGDYDEMVKYKLIKVVEEYEDEYSLVTNYKTEGEIDEVVAYFDQLILNTKGYIKIQAPGDSEVMLQGMINGYAVYIEVTEPEDGVLVVIYLDLTSKK
jgi:hypothetical protein